MDGFPFEGSVAVANLDNHIEITVTWLVHVGHVKSPDASRFGDLLEEIIYQPVDALNIRSRKSRACRTPYPRWAYVITDSNVRHKNSSQFDVDFVKVYNRRLQNANQR